MSENQLSILLSFANVQLAAEAIFGIDPQAPNLPPTPGQRIGGREILPGELVTGNNRSSRFPTVAETQFSRQFRLVEHISNTETGFSGTLFKYVGPDDELSGLRNGDKILSFRSTEFIDDAVRENQATNKGVKYFMVVNHNFKGRF